MKHTLKHRQDSLAVVNTYGAEAITPAELLRNDSDPYRAVVERKLELTGQILRLEDQIARECPETVVFPTPAPDAHLEASYEDQVSGGYGEE